MLAVVASKASSVNPLNTSVVANLDIFDELTAGNNNTGTLVATDKR